MMLKRQTMKFLEFFQQILLTDPTDSERKPVPTLDFNLPFTFSRLLVVIVKSCSDKAILYLPKSNGIFGMYRLPLVCPSMIYFPP